MMKTNFSWKLYIIWYQEIAPELLKLIEMKSDRSCININQSFPEFESKFFSNFFF